MARAAVRARVRSQKPPVVRPPAQRAAHLLAILAVHPLVILAAQPPAQQAAQTLARRADLRVRPVPPHWVPRFAAVRSSRIKLASPPSRSVTRHAGRYLAVSRRKPATLHRRRRTMSSRAAASLLVPIILVTRSRPVLTRAAQPQRHRRRQPMPVPRRPA